MENIEVLNNEVVEEVSESKGSAVGASVIIGGSMVLGAVLWDRVIKPVGRWAKAKIKEARKKHNHKVEAEVAEVTPINE